MKKSLLFLLLAAPAWSLPMKGGGAGRASGMVPVPITAVHLLGPKTDFAMIRASAPLLLFPAIQDSDQRAGEAARARFETIARKTMTATDQDVIAVRFGDQIGLIPAREREKSQLSGTGQAALVSLSSLDAPRYRALSDYDLLLVQIRLLNGDIGAASRMLSRLFED